MDITIKEYTRPDGSNPFRRWTDSLDSQATKHVMDALVRIGMGNTSNIKWLGGVGEYVIHWGPGYRIYLAQDGDTLIILFGGGTKKRQQADINQARLLHQEYKLHKKVARGTP